MFCQGLALLGNYRYNFTKMIGPVVNAITIVVCGLTGCFLVRGIPPRFEEILKKSTGLFVFIVGVKGALEGQHVLLLITSMVAGALIGELINIDGLMNRLGLWTERRLGLDGNKGGGRSFSKGFVGASILFCSGSMAIVGSMQSGLAGNHEILFAKSVLDGAVSVIFGASMGIGVAFSAIPVLIYEALIALASMAVKSFLTDDMIREMSAVGSLVVAAMGVNILAEKEIKVANLIPAIFIPLIYIGIEGLVKS